MLSVSFLSRQFIFSSLVAVAALVCLVAGSSVAQADLADLPTSTVELNGYLWSDNIGWVSLNCRTGGAASTNVCASSNYKVILTKSTGLLSGYGWSNNIGWIKFNVPSGYPVAAGNSQVSARASNDPSSSGLILGGWVRACAGTISPSICTDMTNSTISGGWDGWISLRGTTHSIIISSTGDTSATSYGWGGMVVGWVNFNLMSLILPTATLTGTGCTIPNGANTCATAFVDWEFIDVDSTVTTRRIVRTSPSVPVNIGGAPPVLDGESNTVSLSWGPNLFRAYYSYSTMPIGPVLTLTGSCSTTSQFYTGVTMCDQMMPNITITTDKSLVRSGDTVTVTWTIDPPASQPLDASIVCKVYGPGMPTANQTTLTANSAVSALIKNGSTFKITCTAPGGPGPEDETASVSVDVVPTTQEI